MKYPDPKVVAAVDAALDAWLEDDSVIFGNESGRRKALFTSLKRRSRAWGKPGTCMYRGCAEPTVRSHALQRSRALGRIAEDGHVCTPNIDNEGMLFIDEVGLSEASTFPGFCSRHEDLFSEFEQSGEITTVRHAVLQIFRTVCREIARRRYIIEQLKIDRADYLAHRSAYLENTLRAAGASDDVSITNLSGDAREAAVDEGISRMRNTLLYLDRLYAELMDQLEKGKSRTDGHTLVVPFELPVALSGIVLVDYRKRSERIRTAPCAVGVVPQHGRSVIFVLTLSNHAAFARRWARQLQFGPTMLDLVEGWMTHGTDHWFIRPSLWHNLAPERQSRIVGDLQSLDGVPSADPAEPIFDDLRRTFLQALRDQAEQEHSSNPTLLRLMEQEEAKLNGRAAGRPTE